MTSMEFISGIFLGSRGEDFKRLITGLLKKGGLKQKHIDILTDDEGMDVYSAAFTSELIDEEHNYQVYEQLGDKLAASFLVWYMYRRFPQLNCNKGVKVVARLLINYGAKQCFSDIGKKLGFWEYITATNDLRQRQMKPLIEDVFESFLGATGWMLDNRLKMGEGYRNVYKILQKIFDDMPISLKYNELYDAKTRLKELFDTYGRELGPLVYDDRKVDLLTKSVIYRVQDGRFQERPDGSVNTKKIIGGKYVKIGEGMAALKSDAQQKSSMDALALLNKQGWVKEVPEIYRRFEMGYSSDDEGVAIRLPANIDELVVTKKKTKYQSRYMSTRLAEFMRTRNNAGVEACLKKGASLDIPDSDGMFPLDLLMIGKIDKECVGDIMEIIKGRGGTKVGLKIHQQVFDFYYSKYSYGTDLLLEKI